MRILHCKRGHSALLLKYLVMTFALHGIGAAAVRASTPRVCNKESDLNRISANSVVK